MRADDAFILRFLRARKFDTFEAFKLFGRYFEYRQNHPTIFKDFNSAEQGVKEALFDGIPAVLENPDHYGRKILVLYSANWDNSRYGLAAIYRAILLTLEKLIDDEECQINGFVIIVDWSQFTFRQSTWLNPKILRLMVEGLQVRFNSLIKSSIHLCFYGHIVIPIYWLTFLWSYFFVNLRFFLTNFSLDLCFCGPMFLYTYFSIYLCFYKLRFLCNHVFVDLLFSGFDFCRFMFQ